MIYKSLLCCREFAVMFAEADKNKNGRIGKKNICIHLVNLSTNGRWLFARSIQLNTKIT